MASWPMRTATPCATLLLALLGWLAPLAGADEAQRALSREILTELVGIDTTQAFGSTRAVEALACTPPHLGVRRCGEAPAGSPPKRLRHNAWLSSTFFSFPTSPSGSANVRPCSGRTGKTRK